MVSVGQAGLPLAGERWGREAEHGGSCRCNLCMIDLILRLSLRLQPQRTCCILPSLPFTNIDAPVPWEQQTEVWCFQSVRVSSQNFHLGATAVEGVWPDLFLFFCSNPEASRDAAAQQSEIKIHKLKRTDERVPKKNLTKQV